MSGVTITLQRVDIKGRIAFMPPKEPELQEAIRKVLRTCRDKNNDYVAVTLAQPFKPRTTGPESQNHHLNGHIMQICQATGNNYKTIKDCIKMIAVEQMGYPFQTIANVIIPKPESECSTEECAMLIEASHYLAAEEGIILKEGN